MQKQADGDDPILLNTGAIDTTTVESRAAAVNLGGGKQLHLVQFAGPTRPEWYAALEDSGVEIVQYIPNYAYLVYGEGTTLTQLDTRPGVRWSGDYRDEYKIQPGARMVDADGNARVLATDLFDVQLVKDAEANAQTLALINQLQVAPIVRQYEILKYVNLLVRLTPEAIATLAARPDVVAVDAYIVPEKLDERMTQIMAGSLSGNVPSGPGYLAQLGAWGFTQAQFTASGFSVDVTDSGIDNATTTPNHFALFVNGVRPGTSRVIYNRLEGTPHTGSTLQGCDGHGNLNAHIIGGYSDLTGFPHQDTAGFRFGLGVAPFVKLGSSVIFDPTTFTSPSYPNLQSKAYNDGARISSNGWGGSATGAYTVDAQAYDALVRDAQPTGSTFPTAGNQQMVIVFAVGNAGPGPTTVTSPGTGKNVLTVGASENVHAFGGSDFCGINDAAADSANDMANFSSRGPTADLRNKPDLIAPGTHLTGGVFQVASPPANGQAAGCFSATNVCGGLTPSNFFPAGQQWYTASSGSSHSAPAVAGGAALVRQYFINNGLTPPSPAMTKAFLMSTARYMNGSGAADTLWSNSQGVGMINLGTAFDGTGRVVRDQLPGDMFTASGQSRSLSVNVTSGTAPFRVTLAWTDAPGPTIGAAYVNNLDLEVTIGGQIYLGNVFSGQHSVAGGTADIRNNVESVLLPAGVSGTATVRIKATNIAGDGVPNNATPLDQDFALVTYNGVPVAPAPSLLAVSATPTAESFLPANGAIDPGEQVTVSLSLHNDGNANTSNLVATLLATGGVKVPSGPQNYGVVLAGGSSVARPFSFRASGACGATLAMTLALQDGASNLGTVTFTVQLGNTSTTPYTVSNPTAMVIPASGSGAATGAPASVYPSTITLSGVPGLVSALTVTLKQLNHTFPDDIDVLLVSPGGQKMIILSDAGSGVDAVNANITINDAAAGLVADSGPLASGAFRPTNYGGSDAFPVPAPAGPYLTPATAGTTTMASAFAGSSPNGVWSLYVVDDENVDTGNINGGWDLTLVSTEFVCVSGFADDPLQAALTPVKAVHITQLRQRIDALRIQFGLGAVAWTNPILTPGSTIVGAVHITEMRTALSAVYVAAGSAPPAYTDPSLTSGLPIRAVHVTQLRAAVAAIQ
jgi:subtilisin-like proprotein convertase family protein